MRVASLLIAAVLTASASAAMARQAVSAEAELQAVRECRPIADEHARLACFDRASAPGAATASDDGVAPPAATRHRGPSVAAAQPTPPATHSSGRLVALREGAPGQWRFTLDSGMRWNMVESRSTIELPKPGATIFVKRTPLGGYLLDWGSAVTVRVVPG